MDELVFATRDFAVEAGKAAKSVFENSHSSIRKQENHLRT